MIGDWRRALRRAGRHDVVAQVDALQAAPLTYPPDSRRRVEEAALEAAQTYATANGYTQSASTALVLAGMAIAALASDAARAEFLGGYLGAFPDAVDVLNRWAARLDSAAER